MKRLIAPCLILSLLVGCATTPGGAATQPSLTTLTNEAEASTAIAANVITEGLRLGLIPKPIFWADIAPVMEAMNDAELSMEQNAVAGNSAGWQSANDALQAALAKLTPWVQSINAAKAKTATKPA